MEFLDDINNSGQTQGNGNFELAASGVRICISLHGDITTCYYLDMHLGGGG
jgi:hypothetical protein